MGVFLGIDTSNYTTSVAVCSEDGKVTANFKKLLPVQSGQRGLRQSDALFHHTAQLPQLLDMAREAIGGEKVLAVGASERPRDAEGSYMPCFLAGKAAAKAAACACGAEYFDFSHQCGHISAALYSARAEDLFGERFAAFHVSGGTTEILLVTPSDVHPLKIEKIGGTLDINAGQAIDRAGVMMDMQFPCGAQMEKLALLNCEPFEKPRICVNGLWCNLSGIENIASKLYDKSGNAQLVCAVVIDFILRTLNALVLNLREMYPDIKIVFAGGVMSCSIIKNELSRFGSFADPSFSSDNAAGIALLARRKYFRI